MRPSHSQGTVADGVGWSRKFMKFAKSSMSSASGSVLFDAVIESFGVFAYLLQPGVSSRFCGKRSLLTPISTLYASAENINKDLFCAFQPNRVIVPSLPLRLGNPEIPSAALAEAFAA
jgi:hypothetical protein